MRVVTAPYCIDFHLSYTLKNMQNDFEVCVVGNGVSKFRDCYPNILWVDLPLERRPSLLKDISATIRLYRLIRKWNPDITHSLMPKAGLIAAISSFFARIPVRMHTYTGQVWATKSGVSRYVLWFFDWVINALNTVCLTDSRSQSLLLANHYICYKGQPLPIISQGSLSGVDLSRFNREALRSKADNLRSKLGVEEGTFVFSYIARKTRDKGAIDMLLSFLQVVEKYPDVKLLFVGPDDSLGEVDKLFFCNPILESSVIRVDEAVANHEVYLMLTNVLCLPSYREGFGSIVIDAASLGVPTIGYEIMGLVDAVVKNETGVLVPVGNKASFTDAMVSLVNAPEYLRNLGETAKERVYKYFDANIIYAEQKKFYHDEIKDVYNE
jgi:glycosyltransferase involved in cell wall biosynthesis